MLLPSDLSFKKRFDQMMGYMKTLKLNKLSFNKSPSVLGKKLLFLFYFHLIVGFFKKIMPQLAIHTIEHFLLFFLWLLNYIFLFFCKAFWFGSFDLFTFLWFWSWCNCCIRFWLCHGFEKQEQGWWLRALKIQQLAIFLWVFQFPSHIDTKGPDFTVTWWIAYF